MARTLGSPEGPRPGRWSCVTPFVTILIVFIAYAAAYIWRLSFVVDGVRHFTLADDQMISMRYAENLARGYGLVWNAGEPPVEGFTNFAWVLYMAIFHSLEIPRHLTSAWIQVTGAGCLVVNLFIVRRIAEHVGGGSPNVTLAAVILTAFYVPLNNWAFQGTEVSILTALVSLGALMALRVASSGSSPAPLYALAAFTTVVRPDMIVFGAALAVGMGLMDRKRWRQHLFLGGGFLCIVFVVETLLRIFYFGDPLPNTYYVKMTGFPLELRIFRGVVVTLLFLLHILPLVALLIVGWHKTHFRSFGILLWIFCAQLAYSTFVGGDAWEWWGGSNRFVAIAMPLLFVYTVGSLAHPKLSIGQVGPMAHAVTVSLSVILVINVLAFLPSADGPIRRLTLMSLPPEIAANQAHVRAGLALKEFTDPTASVAVTWAGAIPYYSERRGIDLLGKMDRAIAKGPMHLAPGLPRWAAFIPGHLKWNYEYSIGTLQPDVIEAPLWYLSTSSSSPPPEGYVSVDYKGCWFVRRDSPNVRWDRLSPGGAGRPCVRGDISARFRTDADAYC